MTKEKSATDYTYEHPKARISMMRPNDDMSNQILSALFDNQTTFLREGIVLNKDFPSRFSPEITAGLFITVVGGTGVYCVTKIIEFILTLMKKKHLSSTKVYMRHEAITFILPDDETKCIAYFNSLEIFEEHKSE